jgi:hypothetical protein
MTAVELLERIKSEGGHVTLRENLLLHCVDVSEELLEALRRMKAEVIPLLRERDRHRTTGRLFSDDELQAGAEAYRQQQSALRLQQSATGQRPQPKTKAERRLENLDSRLVRDRVLRGIHSNPNKKRLATAGALIREQMAEVALPQPPEPAEKKFEYRARTPEQWQARMDEVNSFGWKKRARKSKRRTAATAVERS